MSDNPDLQSPFNALPPVVVAVALAILGVEAVLQLGARGIVGGPGAVGWRLVAVQEYAFSPAVWDYVVTRGDLAPGLIRRFFTYAFVHQGFTHLLFGVALLLALGKFVGDVFGGAMLALLLLLVTGLSAAIYGALLSGTVPLFGIYPAVYGLIGAYTYLLWTRLGNAGANRLQAFRLIGFLLALQLVFGALFGTGPQWVADVAGFVVGFALSPVLAPGGFAALHARLRRR